MKDYVKRMIDERNGLQEKLTKLRQFISNAKDVPENKIKLLSEQQYVMNRYLNILNRGLRIEVSEGNCTEDDIR